MSSSRDTNSPPRAPREENTQPVLGREKQRSRTGCRTCRSRKVKCDETPGGCKNCERLNLPCPNSPSYHSDLLRQQPGAPTPAAVPGTQAGLKRSRTYRSCRCCRISKSRCSGERPICFRCRQRGLECSYDGKEAPAWAEAISADLKAGAGSTTPDGYHERRHSSTPASFPGESSQGAYDRRTPTSQSYPDVPNSLSWLTEEDLPEKDRLVLLVEEYFVNVHSLRSFGFIHKPSFMQELDDQSSTSQSTNTLLHIVCALGAKFYALKNLESGRELALSRDFVLRAGTQWAQKAHQQLFADLNNVSVESTMAVVLLHDHDLRLGQYASAFLLTGLGVRMAQALQLNLELSPDIMCRDDEGPPPSARESRRRLAWAIYVMDAWAGQALVNEESMKIQLPCNERSFIFELPCVVQSLEPGSYLPFLSPKTRAEGSSEDLDLIAHFVRLVSIRRKVLRYVKHLGALEAPWIPASEYSNLEASLAGWNDQLPASLRFDRTSIYMRKESSQLGGLLFLHLAYHQTLCDLTQIGMRDLFNTHAGAEYSVEQEAFEKKIQDQRFRHAVSISTIFDEALRHGADALADTWLSVVAHESSRVIVQYVLKDLGTTQKDGHFKQQAISCLYSNLRAIKMMLPLCALAKSLYIAAITMVKKQGLDLPPSMEVSPISTVGAAEGATSQDCSQPLQFAPEHVLDPLAIFRTPRSGSDNVDEHSSKRGLPSERRPIPVAHSSRTIQRTELALDTIHTSAMSAASDAQMLYEATMPLMEGISNMEIEGLQLPSSLDDLQTYIPLMPSNHSSAMQHAFVGMQPSGAGMAEFPDPNAYNYPQPPAPSDLSLTGITSQFPPVTQPPWSL